MEGMVFIEVAAINFYSLFVGSMQELGEALIIVLGPAIHIPAVFTLILRLHLLVAWAREPGNEAKSTVNLFMLYSSKPRE